MTGDGTLPNAGLAPLRDGITPASRLTVAAFGPLTITVDGVVHTPPPRERNVLAVLLAHHGDPVSADRLADQLWAAAPPPSAAGSIQVAVYRLRRMLDPSRAPRTAADTLPRTGRGYALRLAAVDVDLWRFEAAAARAIAEPASSAAVACAEALTHWAGEPYADSGDPAVVQSEVRRLHELRLELIQARARSLLTLDRAERAVAELTPIAEEHPFREGLWTTLALAQYRSLRQAEALATLRRLRHQLANELGMEPSADVHNLERDILQQSPQLNPTKAHLTSTPPSTTGTAGSTSGPRGTPDSPEQTAPPMAPVQVNDPGLVGRDRAVALLTAAVDRLRTGRGGSVILSGEAGIGKSRLVDALGGAAGAAGVRVVVGRCHEADVAPAYWPWLPVLRELAGAHPPPDVSDVLSGAAERLSGDAGAAALRTYDAISRMLNDFARSRPLLIILEDLHWADVSSLRLLAHVAITSRAPLLIMTTMRADPVSDAAALTEALAALSRAGAERLRLSGLHLDDIGRLLAVQIGPTAAALAAVVTDRSDGNPFYAIEFGRLLETRGITDAAAAALIPVPDGIADVLRLGLRRLPAAVREMLDIGSVAGRFVDPSLIATVSGRAGDTVLDALDVGVAAGLLAEGEHGYQFVHSLVRETLYTDLPAGRRCRLHAAVAGALERRLGVDPELLPDVAFHYRLAAPLAAGHAAKAVEHLRAAARIAETRNAFEESVELLRQALDAQPLDPGCAPVQRHGLLVALAAAELRVGGMAAARTHVAAAVAVAEDLRRPDLVADAATVLTGAGVWSWREFGTTDERMIGALSRCLDALPDGPQAALVLATLQMENYYGGQAQKADALGRRSVDLARATGDEDVLRRVLLIRLVATWGPVAYQERLTLAEELLTLPLGGEAEVNALWQYAAALDQAGCAGQADEAMRRCGAAAARMRHTGTDVPIAWWHFMRAVQRDDPHRAEIADAAFDLHRRSTVVALDELVGVAAIRSAEPGDPVPADVVTVAAAGANHGYRALVGFALVEAGDVEGGVALLGPDRDEHQNDYAALASDCLRTAVYAAAGRIDQTRKVLNRIRERSGDVVTFGSIDHLGAVDYFIASGLSAFGDMDGARAAARAAVELCDRIDNRPWGRRARSLLAAVGPR